MQNCISHFIEEGGEGDVLELKVQDPFHRLLLHGVCEVTTSLLSLDVDVKSKQPKNKKLFFLGTVPQLGFYNWNRTNRKESNEDNEDQMEEQWRETEHQPRPFPQDVKGRSLVTHTHTPSPCSCNLIWIKKSCIKITLFLPLMWSCDLCIVFSLRTLKW